MDDAKVWKGLERVSAPPDFEDRVLGNWTGAAGRRRRSAKPACSGGRSPGRRPPCLAVFTVLNLFVFGGARSPSEDSAAGAVPTATRFPSWKASITAREVRAAASDPRTVYLLEQVSDTSSSTIRY